MGCEKCGLCSPPKTKTIEKTRRTVSVYCSFKCRDDGRRSNVGTDADSGYSTASITEVDELSINDLNGEADGISTNVLNAPTLQQAHRRCAIDLAATWPLMVRRYDDEDFLCKGFGL